MLVGVVAGGCEVGFYGCLDLLDAAKVAYIVGLRFFGLGAFEQPFDGGVIAVNQVKFGGFVELAPDHCFNNGGAGRLAPKLDAVKVVTLALLAFFVGLGLGDDITIIVIGDVAQVLNNLGLIVLI